jgi:hypothetical protein
MPRMKHGAFAFCTTLFVTLFATLSPGCGSSNSVPDAFLQPAVDSAPPPPDAFVCTMTTCGTACVDITSDELHCDGCDLPCQTGATCTNSSCVCPPGFLPADLDVGVQEMVRGDLFPGAHVAIYPFLANELDLAMVGYAMIGTQIGTPYTLTDTLGSAPFVAAAFNFDFSAMTAQAAYYATSGTLTFTTACSVGTTGTLTDATFQTVAGLMNPTIDPNGCSFTVASLTFDIGTPCP